MVYGDVRTGGVLCVELQAEGFRPILNHEVQQVLAVLVLSRVDQIRFGSVQFVVIPVFKVLARQDFKPGYHVLP